MNEIFQIIYYNIYYYKLRRLLNSMSQHYFTENPESEIKEKNFTESICGSTLLLPP